MSGTETIYGLHAVRALLQRHPERVLSVQIAERRDDPRAAQIEALAKQHGVTVKRIDARTLAQRLGDVAHQGVLAEVRSMPPWDEAQLLTAVAAATQPIVLALDGVQDPHNLGACLRTADVCGVLAVIVPRDRAAQLNATVRKVAAGAAEAVPVVPVINLARTLKLLKGAGLWVIGAAGDAPQLARDVDLAGGVVLVLGAEGGGLRQLTRQSCDLLARLPSLGTVESLNVSVAAGMLLYETLRQRSVAPKGAIG